MAWTNWAILGILSGGLSYAMAAVVYFTRPDRGQNRLLAVFLTLAGTAWLFYDAVLQLMPSTSLAYGALITTFVFHVASHFVHLLFLSTLPSPLVAPLRVRAVRWVLGSVFALWVLHILWKPRLWDSHVVRTEHVASWVYVAGPLYESLWWLFVFMWLYGGLVAVSAFVDREAWHDRRQARAYLIAFTVHDFGFGIFLGWVIFFPPAAGAFLEWLILYPWPILNIWLTLWLAYAVLRTQLFDIDLRVKWTVSKGTVAAIFLAVFFVVAVIAENVLTNNLGPWIGGLAAGLLLFAINPLQRLGERVADAAMPRVKDTEQYRLVRKKEVYAAAWDAARQDGTVTERERDMLAALQEQLGLRPTEARAIERSA